MAWREGHRLSGNDGGLRRSAKSDVVVDTSGLAVDGGHNSVIGVVGVGVGVVLSSSSEEVLLAVGRDVSRREVLTAVLLDIAVGGGGGELAGREL